MLTIPWQALASDTLQNLLESYVLRYADDGSDNDKKTLQQKVNVLKKELEKGSIVIAWSELHDSFTILSKADFKHLSV